MKTILNVNELNKAIKEVNKVKAVKGITASENIIIQVEAGSTYLIKDNFNSRIKKKVESYKNEDGIISLDANTIKLIAKLKNNEITITENEISLGKKKIKFVNREILTRDSLEDEITDFTVIQKELLRMLEVTYCKAKDEARPILRGIYFNKNETCALDGHRMSVRKSELYSNESEFVVNGESIDILKSLLKKNDSIVNITVYKDYTIFNFNDIELTCRLMEGTFINYKSLISEKTENDFEIKINNTTEIIESLDLIKEIKSNKGYGIVKMYKDSENKLTLESSNTNNGVIEVLEKSEYTNTSNRDFSEKIAFNTIYVIEAIKNLDSEKINIYYKSPYNPAVMYIENKDNYELVLPIRLDRTN